MMDISSILKGWYLCFTQIRCKTNSHDLWPCSQTLSGLTQQPSVPGQTPYSSTHSHNVWASGGDSAATLGAVSGWVMHLPAPPIQPCARSVSAQPSANMANAACCLASVMVNSLWVISKSAYVY